MAYITTRDNTKLYVKDWGAGRPVILMHGWPLSADSWDEAATAIANAGLRAIAYDRRGFGRSDQPWDGYNYDTLADDLAAVIEGSGTQDQTVPIDATGRVVAKAIPNATYIEYDGAPHGLFATHKDRLVNDLLTFLRH